jgi:hypothetical protein
MAPSIATKPLGHVRVIIYDTREPEWSARLQKSVADYLRNAIKDLGKSIPHPFRKMVEDAEDVASRGPPSRHQVTLGYFC